MNQQRQPLRLTISPVFSAELLTAGYSKAEIAVVWCVDPGAVRAGTARASCGSEVGCMTRPADEDVGVERATASNAMGSCGRTV
jgi:hypothetical protein